MHSPFNNRYLLNNFGNKFLTSIKIKFNKQIDDGLLNIYLSKKKEIIKEQNIGHNIFYYNALKLINV